MLHPQRTLNCAGRLISLDHPQVMGILNVTPDSFYDGGKYLTMDAALGRVEQMLEEGAAIIDVGGMSTRPGAKPVPIEEERSRVIPVIAAIHKRFPELVLSVDTVRAEIAREAAQAGAGIINDISAGSMDEAMFETVAELDLPYVLMHMQGLPENMQKAPAYQDVRLEIFDFFIEKLGELRALGLKDIVLDPGFGFGKKMDHNYHLLKDLHIFQQLGLPVLAGISRKSMTYKPLKIKAEESLFAVSALHMVALQQGASVLRVHDVKEASQVIRLFQMLHPSENKATVHNS